MTNAALVKIIVRALRAAANELERGAGEERPPTASSRAVPPSDRPVDEVTRARVLKTLQARGIVKP